MPMAHMKPNVSPVCVPHLSLFDRACRVMAVFGCVLLTAGIPASEASTQPVVKVLFGSDECSFLPERSAPRWVNTRPATNDYVGISSESNPNQKLSPTEQIQAAELNARMALAAEISVSVKETITHYLCEGNCQDKAGLNRDMLTQVDLLARQAVDQTLEGSQIDERYLDRSNCIVHAMAHISISAVEENKKKLIEKLRKLFRFKQLMLLDRSEGLGQMSSDTRGHLERLFHQIGNKLVAADAGHAVCADDPLQPFCRQPADIIYAGYNVTLDKEGANAEFKRRIYKLTGHVRFQDRVIVSFDVACKATGKIGQDYLIDQQAAKACFEKAKPVIEKGMEGSE